MTIPTEQIGSIPRPPELLEAAERYWTGAGSWEAMEAAYAEAQKDTIRRLEETGSPVVTDGEQTKRSFVTYPLDGLDTIALDGLEIAFADGHTRRLPKLTAGPFRYAVHAEHYVREALPFAKRPLKQAVISASALSLVYPPEGIDGYPRDAFLEDLVAETAADIRGCLDAGAHSVQMDFTEGRLSVKLDPSKEVLRQFIELNNKVLDQFTPEERTRIGVHTCPGGDRHSTHSLDVDYTELLPSLFQHRAGNFFVQLASEREPERALATIRDSMQPGQRVFVGVIDVLDPRVETPEQVRDRVLQAARYIPVECLGTTDDCGFSPFGDDTSRSRDLVFAKIRARVEGTRLAAEALGVT